jgi:hypothetical protein
MSDGALAIPFPSSPEASSHPAEPVVSKETAWVIGATTVAVAALTFLGGTPGRYGIPMLTTAAAWYLYRRAPVAYVSFVWWLLFLICFIRRFIDYRSGYSDQSVVLAAPLLAALVCFPSVLRRQDVWKLRSSIPFLLGLTACLYGVTVGFLCLPKRALLISALSWFPPLILGFFVFSEFVTGERNRDHLEYLERTFCWGALLMGAYGLIQYLVAPAWDVLWMNHSGMGSIGSPEPFQIRVFSTMNAPGALGYTLAGALLLLFRRGMLPAIAGGLGFVALLLSNVRAAWAAVAIALILLAVRERRYIKRLMIGAALMTVCVSAITVIAPIREALQHRFQSFTDIEDDSSYEARSNGYEEMIPYIQQDPLGNGLGTMDTLFQDKTSLGSRDSGIWEILLSLGWIGGGVYFVALGILAWRSWQHAEGKTPTETLAGCISIGLICQLGLGSVMIGVTGIEIWSFAAIAMARLGMNEFRAQNRVEWANDPAAV